MCVCVVCWSGIVDDEGPVDKLYNNNNNERPQCRYNLMDELDVSYSLIDSLRYSSYRAALYYTNENSVSSVHLWRLLCTPSWCVALRSYFPSWKNKKRVSVLFLFLVFALDGPCRLDINQYTSSLFGYCWHRVQEIHCIHPAVVRVCLTSDLISLIMPPLFRLRSALPRQIERTDSHSSKGVCLFSCWGEKK